MSNSVDTAVAETSQVPKAATTGKRGHWMPVEILQSAVTIKGGFCKTPTVATTIEYHIGNTIHRFVEMDKNAAWFLKGVGGPKTQKGELKAVQVLQEFREKFHLACGDGDYVATAVAEEGLAAVAGGEDDTQDQDEDDDPMNALDDVVATLAKPETKKTKLRETKEQNERRCTNLRCP